MNEISNLIRAGVVSTVYPERCSCRVVFLDRDNLVSADLPILQSAGAKNKFYSLPDVGDNVLCLMIPNDDAGSGFVIGSFYSDKKNPPAQNQEVSMIKFEDGTSISYDREKHELKIDCVGNIKINGKRIDLNG
ncbi:MAG: phage baseplate assembly protein V [Selenomonadaceae bacterium]|nr:phage baseplate assembly protein V [Selenomonadaceae bacterium]